MYPVPFCAPKDNSAATRRSGKLRPGYYVDGNAVGSPSTGTTDNSKLRYSLVLGKQGAPDSAIRVGNYKMIVADTFFQPGAMT